MPRVVPDLRVLVLAELSRAADPSKAGPMQKYMKFAMPYLGVPMPALRATCRKLFAENRIAPAEAWQERCLSMWRRARYREERYAALELTGHRFYREHQTLATLPMYEEMIVTGAWWDYVDTIASRRLGPLLKNYPFQMRRKMLAWRCSRDMWKRRSAILCQLSFKNDTDLELLYAAIEPSLGSKEFFLQKAIGWALRQYAWTDPAEIVRYLKQNEDRLSPLSKREALKNVVIL